MKKLHEPFIVIIENLDLWEHRRRKNNFFELVFILEGKGMQCVNGFQYPYRKNSIFMLPSTSCHTYEIAEKTTFLFIRFTSNYFIKSNISQIDYTTWFNRLNFIIGNYNRIPGELIKEINDNHSFQMLSQIVLNEYQKKDKYSFSILQSSIFSMLEIVARNIEKDLPNDIGSVDSRFGALLTFIQFHLLDEEKITVKFLAIQFNIAPSYFSEYFKRNTQESFQYYVLKSKLKIAEAKALYTDQSFKEIASDLGFTDSSHLNRMMRKVYHKSLSDVRKGIEMVPIAI